jgi:hypothetical protein
MTTTTMTNKITPRAVAIFKEVRALRYYSAPWLRLANELGLELKLKSGQIILRPDPKNPRRSVWAVEQERLQGRAVSLLAPWPPLSPLQFRRAGA